MVRAVSVRSFITWLVVLLATLLVAQPAALAAPAEQPAPADREAVTTLLDDYYEKRKHVTGAVSIGYFDAEHDTTAQYGHVDIENGVRADEQSVYEWGSTTKLLVWVAIMQLEEQGKLDRTDQVSDHLEGTGLTFEKSFTLQDLMDHRAGFAEIAYPPETTEASEIMELDEALRHYQPEQIYEPGTVTSYSNYGTALAALVVEQVTDESFSDYVRSEIFEPLGMEDTAIRPDWSDNPGVVKQREKNKSYFLMEGAEERYGSAISYVHLYPAGSATGTLQDFLTFGRALLPDTDGSRALFDDPATLTEFFSGSTHYAGTEIVRSSNGLWSLPYGEGVLGHSGNTQGYTSTLYIEPASARGVVVMTNEVAETSYSYGLLEEFFGDYRPDPAALGQDTGVDLAGVYTSARANIPHDSAKFLRYMGGILPLKDDAETGGYRLVVGPGTVEKVGGDVHVMRSGNGLNTLLVPSEESGDEVLQTFTGDNIRESTVGFVARWVSVALFLLITVISLVALVVGLVRRALRALVRRRNPESVAGKALLPWSTPAFHLVQVLLGVAVVALVFMAVGTDHDLARMLAVAVGVLSLALPGVWLIKPLQRVRPSTWLTIVLVISLANVLYWRWFLA